MKIMIASSDGMSAIWLGFFREQFITLISVVVLLPLTMLLNWKLAVTLIVLVVIFSTMTALVMRHTEEGQRQVEEYNSTLAGTAQYRWRTSWWCSRLRDSGPRRGCSATSSIK